MHGVDLLNTHPYQKALVLGDGFGQLFAQILKARGIHGNIIGRSDDKLANNREHFGVKTINTTKEEFQQMHLISSLKLLVYQLPKNKHWEQLHVALKY